MKKVKVRVAIKGDTEVGVMAPEETQQYFDEGMMAEIEGIGVGSVDQLKNEIEVLEEKGKLKEVPEVIFMPRVAGG